MNLIDAIAQPRMLLACAAFAGSNLLLANLERRFHAAMAEHDVTAWLAEQVYLPLGRIFTLLVFIALAHPALFGLHEAPGVLELLRGGEHRMSHLINLAFLLSLLLPLLPLLGRLPGLVLPIQGLLAAAMLFHWLAQARGVDATLWPGWTTAAAILVWLVLAQRLAARGADLLVDHWQADYGERERFYYDSLLLFFQIPALLLYTVGLGEQLH